MNDQDKTSYYVPDEIIYCFTDGRPPNERSESLFKTGQEVIDRLNHYDLLPNQNGFRHGVDGLTRKPFQTVLPAPDQSGQPIVLVKLELNSADDLPAFIEKSIQRQQSRE